jgi:hypothetical protein
MKFIKCNGECTFEGTHCEGCGRAHEETQAISRSLDELVAFAHVMGYENLEDFADGVAGSLKYKLGLLEHK